jgi:hypothetical protein
LSFGPAGAEGVVFAGAGNIVFSGLLVGRLGEGEGLALSCGEQCCLRSLVSLRLALLGAIAGGFVVARTVGAKCWNLLSVARRPTRVKSVDRRVTRGMTNSSVNQASHGHCAGVFIGT